ncbi:MAG: HAD family hydrolase [Chloroflexi bacterium]|nr:HAD family hydrolase [Chloroflexota bacterium]
MTQQLKPTQPIRLIVSDIDHTLLNKEHQLTDRTEAALRSAMDKGVQVVLATGKTMHSAADIIRKLNLTTPGIYAQGTIAYNADGTLRHQYTLEPAVARQIITFAEDRGFSVVAYSGNRLLLRRPHPAFTDMMERYHEPTPEVVGPLQNVMGSLPINKLVAFSFDEDAPRKIVALRWQLNMQIDTSAARLMQAGVSQMIEILPPGASKGAMLRQLLKDLQIRPEEVLAVGDAENDIEMIQLAGVGVAVGNAAPHVQAVADYVAPRYDEDGVANAVERFVLKRDETAQPAVATGTAAD